MTDFASFDRICDAISESRDKRVVLTFHSVGDRDGVGSAIALSSFFRDSIIVTPDFLTGNAKRMLAQAGYTKKIGSSFPQDRELAIVTDANNLEVLNQMKRDFVGFGGSVLFIDHHAIGDYKLPRNMVVFNDEKYNSASSIVYEILKRNGAEITKQSALLILNGIIADSSDFQNATPLTFRQVSELLEIAETDYAEIKEYFHQDIGVERRYGLMKDLFAARTEMLGDYILMHGKASEGASLVAQTAINFGADGSVFWSEREDEITISARLRAPLDRKLGIHLGRSMQEAGKGLGGTGGGHPCAAGAYGPVKENGEKMAGQVIDMLRNRFSESQ
ncbi:MAG TPA: DHH family phosphoesterase [Candidatus Saccharimonadales bacterium]|nr:DHH family phosphoesterase [Candidatus Saccharimonadales bacterium]